jgi:hypothetical protein
VWVLACSFLWVYAAVTARDVSCFAFGVCGSFRHFGVNELYGIGFL